LKEENFDLLVKALKDYKESKNLGDILKIITGYSRLDLCAEVKKYIQEFLERGGNIKDLARISKDLPESIRNIIFSGDFEIDGEFDADSFLEMGALLWEIGSPDEAKENYLKAFEYYALLGNKSSAEQVLKTLKENYPDDLHINALGVKDIREEVTAKLKSLIVSSPGDEVDLRYALGKSFHSENLLAEAEANYRRILELNGSHNSKRLLVALLRDRGSFEDSLDLARELEGKEKLEELYSIAQSLRNSGKTKEGEAVLKEIYEIDPAFRDTRELLGISRVKEQKEEKTEKITVAITEEEEKSLKVGDTGRRDNEFKDKKIVFL
jgi:tetratricopeptide (TPR) repeat protein